jgi:cyclohexanone monooxygenase
LSSKSPKEHVDFTGKRQAVAGWVQLMQDLLGTTLLGAATELKSWFMGANVPGKAHAPLRYFGGAAGYFDELAASRENGFKEFRFDVERSTAPA